MVNLRGDAVAPEDWYTGLPPVHGVCPGVGSDGIIRSLPTPNLSNPTRDAVAAYLDNGWTLFECLFRGLKSEEAFYRPPVHGLRHPQIFYYGHTPCVFVNKLRVAGVLDAPVDPYMESIMEVGVDEMLWDDMHKNNMEWPTVSEVHAYRRQVYGILHDIIASHPRLDGSPITWEHPLWGLFMGCEHDRIHLETSSVLFREMPADLVELPPEFPPPHPSSLQPSPGCPPPDGVPSNPVLPVSARRVALGKPTDFPTYGWDNEYGQRQVEVPGFEASRHMITNGEMWAFVKAGGYRSRRYWSEEGWAWRRFRNLKWPFFWAPFGPAGLHQYRLRTTFTEVDMQWDWPVNVTYHEARAYCAWKTEQDGNHDTPYRLITEAEHQAIRHPASQAATNATSQAEAAVDAAAHTLHDPALHHGGATMAAATTTPAANLNLAWGSESPVTALPASPTGHTDTMGNVWEWTEDHFNPLDGFRMHPCYDDFSTPCFDGHHNVIMGGSFISTGDEATAFARFHFRRHFLQHAGFRIVKSDSAPPVKHLAETERRQSATHEQVVGDGDATSAAAAPDAADSARGEDHTNVYERQSLLDQYLGLHYPSSGAEEGVPPMLAHEGAPTYALRFPQRVAELLSSLRPTRSNGRVLDVGCAVGGSSFELARHFDDVVAFDFSSSFVEAAIAMQKVATEGAAPLTFNVPVEGEAAVPVQAKLDAGIDAATAAKVAFHVGDACSLVEDAERLGTFDGAILANLLCRLPKPLACLDGLAAVLNPGGVALFCTPFSWLEEFTPRDEWLGGYRDEHGRIVSSRERLEEEMHARGFSLIHEEEVPLVIREHQRKYQYIVSAATAWRKAE